VSLTAIAEKLGRAVDRLEFSSPVAHVYNPLRYAWEPHRRYLERLGTGPKDALFLGMNPGPFGMAQTGVPFGDVAMVRDFLGIAGRVDPEPHAHPKRPIAGFSCTRSEVSGTRLWSFLRTRFGTPERFFASAAVLNYCPLMFLEESGRNLTPDKLVASERTPLLALCDRALAECVAELRPRVVVGVGVFAEQRAKAALAGFAGTIGTILHPSPASPKANRDWAGTAARELEALGVRSHRTRTPA